MKKLLLLFLTLAIVLCSCDKKIPDSGLNDNDSDDNTSENENNEDNSHPDTDENKTPDNEIDSDNSTTPEGDSSKDDNSKDDENSSSNENQNKPRTINLTKNSNFSELYLGKEISYGCTINGSSQSVQLKLPSAIYLRGDLTLNNVTLVGNNTVIYANGHKLTVNQTVKSSSSSDRLTVYGGSNGALKTDTDLVLLGGHYSTVYGGCNGNTLTGKTNVLFGGNANLGDGNDDSASNISPCIVYGGGNNGAVSVATNVTIAGNAVAKFVSGVGAGAEGGKVPTANVEISGGKIMNVFGGSLNADISDVEVNITVTGGLCEAIFGGCQAKNMKGNVNITLLGGDISRRVYTGCYNNCDVEIFSQTWSTACQVTGTTTLSIGPDIKLCTKTGLSSDNDADMGVYCGSRYKSAMKGETNILIFLDGCYDKMISQIGPSSNGWFNICKSYHSEIIKK